MKKIFVPGYISLNNFKKIAYFDNKAIKIYLTKQNRAMFHKLELATLDKE